MSKKESKKPKKGAPVDVYTMKSDVVTQVKLSAIYGLKEAFKTGTIPSHPNYTNPRDVVDETVIGRVVDSGKILQDVELYVDPETSDIIIVDGRNRLTGALRLAAGDESVFEAMLAPAKMLSSDYTPSEIRARMIRANTERANLTQLEEAKSVVRMIEGGTPEAEVLAEFGRNNKMGKRWLNAMREVVASSTLTKAVASGDIDLTSAQALARTAETEEDKKQKIDEIKQKTKKYMEDDGLSREQAESKARVKTGAAKTKLTAANAADTQARLTVAYNAYLDLDAEMTAPAFDSDGNADEGQLNGIVAGTFSIRGETVGTDEPAIDLDECTAEEATTFFSNRTRQALIIGQLHAYALTLRCKFAGDGTEKFDEVFAWVRDNVITEKDRKKDKNALFIKEEAYWGDEPMAKLKPKMSVAEKKEVKKKDKKDKKKDKPKKEKTAAPKEDKVETKPKKAKSEPAEPEKPAKKDKAKKSKK